MCLPNCSALQLDERSNRDNRRSSKRTGGVFSREGRSVIYVSRKLSKAGQNYSNIEREPIAIVFVVTRLKKFLLARRFTLKTDHKPLKYLFAPIEEIPKNSVSNNHEIGYITDWIRFRIEIYTQRANPSH